MYTKPQELNNKTVLVTGGGGFIGSNLCAVLLTKGYHVLCLDDFSTGSRSNIYSLLQYPNFSVIDWDVIEPISLHVDYIVNLACPASPIHYQKDAIRTIRTNVQGAINMLELAKRLNVPILQASTSEVYGDPKEHPQVETYWGNVNPIGLRSCYDEGKRCAEALFFSYYRQYNVQIKVIRIFNTYGPMMQENDGRVISNFICQALRNEDITIYGDGSQTRSFCYIRDLIRGILDMLFSNTTITGPVNFGNPNECTIKEIAEKIIKLTNSSSKIIYKELPKDDPIKRKPDIDLADTLFNWKPEVSLDDGLNKTITYFRRKLGLFTYGSEGEHTAPLTYQEAVALLNKSFTK